MTWWCVIWSYQNIAVLAGVLHADSIAKAFLTLHENLTWHYSNIASAEITFGIQHCTHIVLTKLSSQLLSLAIVWSEGDLLTLTKQLPCRSTRRHECKPNRCISSLLQRFHSPMRRHVRVYISWAACIDHDPSRLELLSQHSCVAGLAQFGNAIHALWPSR